MSDLLSEVMRDMAFIGWKGEPSVGFSHKEDVNGQVIARHHDATWVSDVEECTARAERRMARDEIERRANLREIKRRHAKQVQP